MSKKSDEQGRAYEYAWITTLYDELSKIRNTTITKNSSLETNRRSWNSIPSELQNLFKVSANAAVDTILKLEPLMTDNSQEDELILTAQKDEAGMQGDVRDIVVSRDNIKWEIGLSIKHNHNAIKHSRLSRTIDFGQKWFNIPCSKEYWDDVNPIFDFLESDEISNLNWSELENKEDDVYYPLLKAFMNEIIRAYSSNKNMPRNMIEYLIGTNDYYKVVSHDSKKLTLIHTFNMHKTLNKPSKLEVSAFEVPITNLPTELIAVKFAKGKKNKIEMYLNNGWQLSFRIHNASTHIQSSLKFDIQFIGMPVSILNIECKWR